MKFREKFCNECSRLCWTAAGNLRYSRDETNRSSGFFGCSWTSEDEQVQVVLSGQKWDYFLNFTQVVRSFTQYQNEIHALYLQNGSRRGL